MIRDRRLRLIAIVTFFVVLGLLAAGCGKKGDPIVPRIKPVAAMESLHRDGEGFKINQ